MAKQIFLLNGPSSSGKSTLAKALQDHILARTDKNFPIVSIDDFMKLSKNEVIYEDDVFEISGDMIQKALEYLQTADGVIIDHVITSSRIFQQLLRGLSHCHIRLIKVTCPPEILLQREISRGDRHPGSAEASFTYLYPKDGYHLTVDTHLMTTDRCARMIFEKYF